MDEEDDVIALNEELSAASREPIKGALARIPSYNRIVEEVQKEQIKLQKIFEEWQKSDSIDEAQFMGLVRKEVCRFFHWCKAVVNDTKLTHIVMNAILDEVSYVSWFEENDYRSAGKTANVKVLIAKTFVDEWMQSEFSRLPAAQDFSSKLLRLLLGLKRLRATNQTMVYDSIIVKLNEYYKGGECTAGNIKYIVKQLYVAATAKRARALRNGMLKLKR